jgi:hypothetical protein
VDALVVSRRKGEITRLRARQGIRRRAAARPHASGSRRASGVAHDAITDAEVTGAYLWSYAASAHNLAEMLTGVWHDRYLVSPMRPQLQSSEFMCPGQRTVVLIFPIERPET